MDGADNKDMSKESGFSAVGDGVEKGTKSGS